jgi:hypothetical protein
MVEASTKLLGHYESKYGMALGSHSFLRTPEFHTATRNWLSNY